MTHSVADVRIVSVEDGVIMAKIMAWCTFESVRIPNEMLTEEFVTDLNIHLNKTPEREFRVNALLNLEAENEAELFQGARFVA